MFDLHPHVKDSSYLYETLQIVKDLQQKYDKEKVEHKQFFFNSDLAEQVSAVINTSLSVSPNTRTMTSAHKMHHSLLKRSPRTSSGSDAFLEHRRW